MGLRTWREGNGVRGEVTFDRRQEGAPGVAHGGALATVIDDALGSLLMVIQKPAVTARLEVDFRRPAPLGRTLIVEAWQDRAEGRKLHLAARVSDQGQTIAEGSGLFLEVPIEHFSEQARQVWKAHHGSWPRPVRQDTPRS